MLLSQMKIRLVLTYLRLTTYPYEFLGLWILEQKRLLSLKIRTLDLWITSSSILTGIDQEQIHATLHKNRLINVSSWATVQPTPPLTQL